MLTGNGRMVLPRNISPRYAGGINTPLMRDGHGVTPPQLATHIVEHTSLVINVGVVTGDCHHITDVIVGRHVVVTVGVTSTLLRVIITAAKCRHTICRLFIVRMAV